MPRASGSGFPVGPQPQVEIAAPRSGDPQPCPQSSECAARPAARGGPSPLPEGPFNSLSLPSHPSFLFWGPLSPVLLLFIFGPRHFLSGVVVVGEGDVILSKSLLRNKATGPCVQMWD